MAKSVKSVSSIVFGEKEKAALSNAAEWGILLGVTLLLDGVKQHPMNESKAI